MAVTGKFCFLHRKQASPAEPLGPGAAVLNGRVDRTIIELNGNLWPVGGLEHVLFFHIYWE